MSEQELEEQISSEETLNDETGEETWTPDTTTKNKSNFKKLSESLKAERKAREEAERRAQLLEEENEAWRSENPDLVKETLTKKETKWVDRSELALFIAVNPEAREHLDAIKEFAEEFGIKLDTEEALTKAWKRVKPSIPKESESKSDFSIKWKAPSAKVDISKLSFQEIYSTDDSGKHKFSPEQRAEWRKMKG